MQTTTKLTTLPETVITLPNVIKTDKQYTKAIKTIWDTYTQIDGNSAWVEQIVNQIRQECSVLNRPALLYSTFTQYLFSNAGYSPFLDFCETERFKVEKAIYDRDDTDDSDNYDSVTWLYNN